MPLFKFKYQEGLTIDVDKWIGYVEEMAKVMGMATPNDILNKTVQNCFSMCKILSFLFLLLHLIFSQTSHLNFLTNFADDPKTSNDPDTEVTKLFHCSTNMESYSNENK